MTPQYKIADAWWDHMIRVHRSNEIDRYPVLAVAAVYTMACCDNKAAEQQVAHWEYLQDALEAALRDNINNKEEQDA